MYADCLPRAGRRSEGDRRVRFVTPDSPRHELSLARRAFVPYIRRTRSHDAINMANGVLLVLLHVHRIFVSNVE